jgi:hypothetical protein
MDKTSGTLGISGGKLPKLSFFGETPSFLVLIEGFSATVCADAAVKNTNAESRNNSKTLAAAIARINHLKRFVNNQFPP